MKKETKTVLIAAGIVAAVTATYFMSKLVRSLLKGYGKKPRINEYTKTVKGGTIVTEPKTKFPKTDVVIVYGGISFATPSFMLKELESSKAETLLYSNIFIFVPYNNSWSATTMTLNRLRERMKIGNVSIIGFSAGGSDVQEHLSDTYKFIGLIDPSTNASHLQKSFGKNVRMIYNDSNWTGKYAGIGRTLVKLEDVINKSGGKAEKVSKPHRELPKHFYEAYYNKINGTS